MEFKMLNRVTALVIVICLAAAVALAFLRSV
jgi:preprotein translocase subunit SecG